jgi:anti-sigma-K factor RskA
MKITDPRARSLLAAEYVTGAMHGGARRRFELWLRSDPALRREVAQWAERLETLDAQVPEVAPSPAVWEAIAARVDPARRAVTRNDSAAASADRGGDSWWNRLGFWRFTSGLSTAAVALMAGWLVIAPPPPVEKTVADVRVVVLNDAEANPRMTVSWTPDAVRKDHVRLRVRVIRHDTMDPGTTWELWCLPKDAAKPTSVGLMNTDHTQEILVPASLVPALERASGMAMSVEPKGGSPTGLPTGPIPYKGAKVEL